MLGSQAAEPGEAHAEELRARSSRAAWTRAGARQERGRPRRGAESRTARWAGGPHRASSRDGSSRWEARPPAQGKTRLLSSRLLARSFHASCSHSTSRTGDSRNAFRSISRKSSIRSHIARANHSAAGTASSAAAAAASSRSDGQFRRLLSTNHGWGGHRHGPQRRVGSSRAPLTRRTSVGDRWEIGGRSRGERAACLVTHDVRGAWATWPTTHTSMASAPWLRRG